MRSPRLPLVLALAACGASEDFASRCDDAVSLAAQEACLDESVEVLQISYDADLEDGELSEALDGLEGPPAAGERTCPPRKRRHARRHGPDDTDAPPPPPEGTDAPERPEERPRPTDASEDGERPPCPPPLHEVCDDLPEDAPGRLVDACARRAEAGEALEARAEQWKERLRERREDRQARRETMREALEDLDDTCERHRGDRPPRPADTDDGAVLDTAAE